MSNYPYSVGPGWWPLLDARLPAIKALVPGADIHIKEKYGLCRVQFFCLTEDRVKMEEAHRIAHEIEAASAHICEICGAAGEVVEMGGWLTCLCDRCAALAPEDRSGVEEEVVARYKGPLSEHDICWDLLGGERIFVVRNGEAGRWETVDKVHSFMDVNDLLLINGERLPVEEYGRTWLAYRAERTKKQAKPPKTEDLLPCPICGADPWLYEDIDDIWVYCTDGCRSPRCAHADPRHSVLAWNDWVRWYRPGYTFSDLLFNYSGDRNKVKLYKCRFSIIGDGAPYPWPEQDLVAAAPNLADYFNCQVQRWEVVDNCLCVVVGFISSDYENHY